MTDILPAQRMDVPGFVPPLRRTVTVRVTRQGQQTSNPKLAILFAGITDRTILSFFVLNNGVSATRQFDPAAIDGRRVVMVLDEVEPVLGGLIIPNIVGDVVLGVDVNDGSGAGDSGVPAKLSAVVRVDQLPAERTLVAIERKTDGAWRVAGQLRTAEGEMDLRVTGGDVYALAVDDPGIPFQGLLAVEEGTTIRPTHFRGWLYRITQAGQLPVNEPDWWAAEGDNAPREVGTARAIAVRYFRPLAHGPVTVEMI